MGGAPKSSWLEVDSGEPGKKDIVEGCAQSQGMKGLLESVSETKAFDWNALLNPNITHFKSKIA